MKTKIFKFSIILLLFLQSCANFDPSTVDDSASTTSTTTIELTPHSFDLCAAFFEGVKHFNVYITVDIVDNNGNVQSNYYRDEQTITNNGDLNASPDPFKFENVEVPETGSYLITVTYSTTDCFVCCHNATCDAYDVDGVQWPGGKPFYRGIKMMRNQSDVPLVIFITLDKQCF